MFTNKGTITWTKWDLVVNKFILNLPNVSKDLRLLSIRHDPPLNGKGDTVDGNLLRRKTL
ncbi:CGH_1_HP_G0102970.mRNA.1.CDS.1 [Saccharomyces cerevisiae]|nr:CGH_1_HP_G0102970.mRNA.1.CDS.1 [Saccharomyces cerevisiae]CAI6950098.1 CGH_1_HP_G0102970.mRNA.1.CDS.1 [Saccharomyces cerevisiae]